MEKDKKVTALYCRLSKDDGSNSESLSIRTQKSMLMEYATRNGFGNCQYYVDDGYSGTNSDRPAFQELLDDIREGKVATVITKDQSRLGRNHIETGTYMEIFFPEHGVRYIAINDGYDSNEQSQMDIAPFRNIINEMYAKDTSRKIKSALRTRKKSGKYISSGAPFGYQKDPADHNHLVIDPNTAPVVEYIYSMAEEGLGLHRIAKRLHDEKVLKPCYYKKEMFGRFIDDEKMYDWDSAYISQVLHSPVYAGHIIYEAKPTVSMKSKKRRYIPFEERAIVPNTHEAIIPQDRWENVQRILYSRSSSFMCDKTDYDNIFKGIVRCADCGRTMLVKVEHRRKRNSVLDQTFYCCSTYRKYGAKACDSHNLEARVLHEAVFADIQAHAKAAVSNREALVKKIANQMHLRVSSGRAQHKRDLKQCKARIAEIEDLYAKLYEDVSKGLLPEKRFQMLADRYDKEQAELTEKIEQYEREGRAEHDQLDKIQDFIDEVSKYAGITELNYKILHQLIDKILVSRAEKVDGEYVQKIQIFLPLYRPIWMPSSNKVRKVTSENYPTDAGREGELIFRLVYQQAGCKKALLSSMAVQHGGKALSGKGSPTSNRQLNTMRCTTQHSAGNAPTGWSASMRPGFFSVPVQPALGGRACYDPGACHDGGSGSCHCRLHAREILHGCPDPCRRRHCIQQTICTESGC